MWCSRAGACRALTAAAAAILHRAPAARRCSQPPSPAPEPPQDLALPNGSWSAAMQRHYRRLLATTTGAGGWRRLPSYRNTLQHFPGGRWPGRGQLPTSPPEAMAAAAASRGDTRLFLRAIEGDGRGFEYAMFLQAAERRLRCLFQPGPYLEGHPGLAHGGAIAAIMDSALGTCALAVAGPVMTANLSIDYLAPVPLGSVLLVEAQAERVEGRKVFLAGQLRGAEGDTLHARATGLFIRLDTPKTQEEEEEGAR